MFILPVPMSGVIFYFILLVQGWNWFCDFLEEASGGSFPSWYYMVNIIELELLSESSIIVWLCQQYTACTILLCLELFVSLVVIITVGVIFGCSKTIIGAAVRWVLRIGNWSSAGQGDRTEVLGVKDELSMSLEDISLRERAALPLEGDSPLNVSVIEWEDLPSLGVSSSRRITREEDLTPRGERRSRGARLVRRSTRLGKRGLGMESRQTSLG